MYNLKHKRNATKSISRILFDKIIIIIIIIIFSIHAAIRRPHIFVCTLYSDRCLAGCSLAVAVGTGLDVTAAIVHQSTDHISTDRYPPWLLTCWVHEFTLRLGTPPVAGVSPALNHRLRTSLTRQRTALATQRWFEGRTVIGAHSALIVSLRIRQCA